MEKGWYVDAGAVEVLLARSVTDVVEVLALNVTSDGKVEESP
jgi:hypothetical protein